MRKVAIAFLLRSCPTQSSIIERDPAFFLPSRHFATQQSNSAFATSQDAVVVALSATSTGASQIRKALEKKKAPRPKTNKSGCSKQDSQGAERALRTEISTAKATTRSTGKTTAVVYAEDSAHVAAAKKARSSVRVVAMEKATEPVVEAENVTLCKSAVVEEREELASCKRMSANSSSVQEDLTEIIAKLDLKTYKNGEGWEGTARRLLDHGIPLAYVIDMLKKCRNLACSKVWVDSTLGHFTSLGMSHQEMGRVIAKWPTILNVTDSMFLHKIEFFESIGVNRQFLGKTITMDTAMVITKPLSVLKKNVAFWDDYLDGTHVNVAGRMMLKNLRVLTLSSFQQKVAWLEAHGFEKKWFLSMSSILSLSLPLLISKAEVLERFGISDERDRARVLMRVCYTKIPKLQARFDNLLTAGFSRDQVQRIISKTPTVLTCTEDYVNSKVNYVLNVMKESLDAMVLSTGVWTYSLERRIKSRHEVLKSLQSLGALQQNVSLEYMIRMKNVDFNRRFVQKLQDAEKQACTVGFIN